MRLLYLFFLAAASLWAADPIIGKWVLDVSASKIPAGETGRTEIYEEASGGKIRLTVSVTRVGQPATKGTPRDFPATGGMLECTACTPGRLQVETHIGPGEWRVTSMQDGKQYATMHKKVDRNVMLQIGRVIEADGRVTENLFVYRRQ